MRSHCKIINFLNRSQISTIVFLTSVILIAPQPMKASAADYSKASVTASENISTEITASGIKIYLDTFRPNMDLFANFSLHVNATLSATDKSVVSVNNTNGILQFHFKFGSYLTSSAKSTPLATVKDGSGTPRIQVFGMPKDFPIPSITGSKSAISDLNFLTTPTTDEGAYAIATKGLNVVFFVKSPRFIVGFRELSDAKSNSFPSGTPRYAYLEQKQLNHESLSPGIWKFLDSTFEVVGRVNTFNALGQVLQSDGHDMTISPDGNPVVMTIPTRSVDSSWLAKPYSGPIVDCLVAEVSNGETTKSFSLWDWANSHRSEAKALLDAGLRDADPAQPTGPSDICHANSIQYYAPANEYLLSSRSLSTLFILDSNLTTVKSILSSPGSMQHFARFTSKNQITVLGNYTQDKSSRFQTWNLINGNWELSETTLPIHVLYCGNAQMIDKSHLWVGGGCQAFAKNTLGVLYDVSGPNPTEVARLMASSMGYAYRTDIY